MQLYHWMRLQTESSAELNNFSGIIFPIYRVALPHSPHTPSGLPADPGRLGGGQPPGPGREPPLQLHRRGIQQARDRLQQEPGRNILSGEGTELVENRFLQKKGFYSQPRIIIFLVIFCQNALFKQNVETPGRNYLSLKCLPDNKFEETSWPKCVPCKEKKFDI